METQFYYSYFFSFTNNNHNVLNVEKEQSREDKWREKKCGNNNVATTFDGLRSFCCRVDWF